MKFVALVATMLIAVAGYSQRIDSTSNMKYSLPSSFDLKKPPINYTIVKPPQRNDVYAEAEKVIVKLKSEPGKRTSSGRIAISSSLEQQQSQFLQDLQRIESRVKAGRSNSITTEITHRYKRVFNGFAISTSKGVREELEKLDYVASISEDKEVKMTDLQSSTIINAPKVWSQLNITGKGVRIGILDTGIDYNHPDLGGGFGPSFKVIGGYDFINNDTDPIDDHGHGTHVAGIAAANGPGLKGVAPDAKLVAYKVLSAAGYGSDSGILAAVERTVDPDQNPNTDDALDVVNMSLGRYADPFEPMSEAVNNAVDMGVVFVVAAGNNYDYMTVGTPGIARNAITVGATDSFDQTAFFSSKGAVEKDFSIKPDVAAPGVAIYSSIKDGGYQSMDGTSMASPHVAGAVALMLEQHPTWTPEMVKGALMNTAIPSAENIWGQGSGRIDAFEAINCQFIVTPGSLSFGRPDKSSTTWTKSIKAKVFNLSASSKSFTTSIHGFSDAAMNTTITPSTFTLSGNSSREIEVKLTVNTSTLPIKSFPEYFSGDLVVVSDGKIRKSPIAMVNPQTTKLVFENDLPGLVIVLGIEGSWLFKFVNPTTNEHNLFLPLGKYDIITQFLNNRTVITEGVFTDVDRTITLSPSQAKNLVVFKPKDVNGNTIPITPETFGAALFTGKERNLVTFYPYAEDTFYINNQNVYRYDMKMHGTSPADPDHYYEVSASTGTGITNNMDCTNSPDKFTALNITNPSAGNSHGLQFSMMGGGFTMWNSFPIPAANPFKLLSAQLPPDVQLNAAFARFVPIDDEPGYTWETGVWKSMTDNQLVFQDRLAQQILAQHTTNSFDYKLGETLPRFAGPMVNSAVRIGIMDIFFNGVIKRYYGERERGTVHYKIFDDNVIIHQGNFVNFVGSDISSSSNITFTVPQKAYRMNLSYDDYQVQGKFGHANFDLYFDNSLQDKNPPYIKSLKLDLNGLATNKIPQGQSATLRFALDDYCTDPWGAEGCLSSAISGVVVKIRKQGETDWITVSNSGDGFNYEAPFPSNLQTGYYELKMDITDGFGNRSENHLDPGFLVGDPTSAIPYTTVNLIAPRNKAIDAGVNPAFRWSALPSAMYTIQISETPDFNGALIVNTEQATNTLGLPEPLIADKTYYWRVRANSNDFEYPWSVVNSFFTGTLYAPILLEPQNNQTQVSNIDVLFKWEAAKNASGYFIDVWRDEAMTDLVLSTFTPETSYVAAYLSGSTQHFWRVQSVYLTPDFNYFMPSTINRFTTGINTGIDDEIAREFYCYPNPLASQTRFVIVPKNSGVHILSIRDALGKSIKTFSEKIASMSEHQISWDGKDHSGQQVPPGIYFVQLQTQAGVRNLKLMVHR